MIKCGDHKNQSIRGKEGRRAHGHAESHGVHQNEVHQNLVIKLYPRASEPTPDQVKVYFWTDTRQEKGYLEDELLFLSPQHCLEKMAHMSPYFSLGKSLADNPNFQLWYMPVNKNCIAESLVQDTQVLLKKENNTYKFVGSSNYLGIHKLLQIPFYIDIEQQYPDHILIALQNFEKKFEIISK